jgi:hypothetical protein
VLRVHANARSGSELHFQEASRAAQMRKSSLPHPLPQAESGKTVFLVETEPLGVSMLRRGRDEASLLMALNTTGCARSVRSR